MTPDQRSLLGVRAAMGKLGNKVIPVWSLIVEQGGDRYVVMGAAVDPEKQFRQVWKMLPNGTQPLGLYIQRMRASRYMAKVQELRAVGTTVRWGLKPLVQVVKTNRGGPELLGLPIRDELRQWMTPKRVGRPPRAS